MKTETKYQGSLKLSAIGDALGWMTERIKSANQLKSRCGCDYITSFHHWKLRTGGRFYGYVDDIKAGSYSDDTQLLLAVARSIRADGFVNQAYFAKMELPNWLKYARGAGRTCKNAARKIERKSAKWNNNFFSFKIGDKTVNYRESGSNGAAMRILPIALANFGNVNKIKEEIFANSIITHGHPKAILGAMIYGYALNTLLGIKPEDFDDTTFLTNLAEDFHTTFAISFIEKPTFKVWENEWNKKSDIEFQVLFDKVLIETQASLRELDKLISNHCTDSEVLSTLGCYQDETKGSGTSTVLAGLYFACQYAKEPLTGIKQAVNSIGTDTDTIAGFTGGLIGALHGQSIIPSEWETVQDMNYLENVAVRLFDISENRATPITLKKAENIKSITDIQSDNYHEQEKIYCETLGCGTITQIDRQNTVTGGKFNLILRVAFEIGQTCVFSKLLVVSFIKHDFPKR